MKNLVLSFLVLAGFSVAVAAQSDNLIANYSFDDFSLGIDCTGWYDRCGNELTVHCDTVPVCQVGFHSGSPSFILEDVWSLHLYGCNFPSEGFAETYITGQEGTFVYELRAWTQIFNGSTLPRAVMALGLGSQGNFVESKSVIEHEKGVWKELVLTDTLTTVVTDTITVHLSAGDSDVCINEAYFDLVSLRILDTLMVPANEAVSELEARIYPNPSDGQFMVSLPDESVSHSCVLEVYDLRGQRMHVEPLNARDTFVNLKTLPPGVYICVLRTTKSEGGAVVGCRLSVVR